MTYVAQERDRRWRRPTRSFVGASFPAPAAEAAKSSDRILVLEDDRRMRELVTAYLAEFGMRVTAVPSGRDLRAAFDRLEVFDMIVLAQVLRDEDGIAICRELRAGTHKSIPILMLTERDDEADRILGLEMGADDCLNKPFVMRELLARIRAVLRRARMLPPSLGSIEASTILEFGEWRLDTIARHLTCPQGKVQLSSGEYRLLRVFLDHPQRVLNRDQLINMTKGRDAELFERSVDLMVSRLRRHLQDCARSPRYIKTVRSEGYVFASTVEPLKREASAHDHSRL